MRATPENLPQLPLHLSANPDIDSPESLLATMSRLTGAYFDADDFPIDAVQTVLMRSEAVTLLLQCQMSGEDRLSDELICNVLWTIEGLNSEALTMLRIWGRHATVKRSAAAAKHGIAGPEPKA